MTEIKSRPSENFQTACFLFVSMQHRKTLTAYVISKRKCNQDNHRINKCMYIKGYGENVRINNHPRNIIMTAYFKCVYLPFVAK